MAQGDLYKLLRRVSKSLEYDMDSSSKGGSERFRDRLEKIPHDLYLNKNDLINEILIQIQDFKQASTEERTVTGKLGQAFRKQYGSGSGNTREQAQQGIFSRANADGLPPTVLAAVTKEAEYIIKSSAKLTRATTQVSVKKIGGDGVNDLVLRFTPKVRGKNNTYDAINSSIIVPAKDRMTRLLATVIKDLSAKDLKDVNSRFLNVGHIRSVSEIKAARNLELLNRETNKIIAKSADPGKQAADIVRLQILSKFGQLGDPEIRKQFLVKVASVKPESEAANQTDSVYEKALLSDLKKALSDALNSLPNDWAGQKSSDSVIDLLTADILNAMKPEGKNIKRVGAKVKRKQTRPSSASTDIALKKPKVTPISSKVGKLLDAPAQKRASSSPVSLLNLIPIINQRLPEVIRSHMGTAGRLVNRTGRFSEGPQVIALDKNSLTLSYTYQLSPYQVFEDQGARDPRPLIEQSIREIAKGMIEQRFNLRRL